MIPGHVSPSNSLEPFIASSSATSLIFALFIHLALFADAHCRSAFLPASFASLRMSSSSNSPVHHIDTILLDASSSATSMTLNEIDSLRHTFLLSNPSDSLDSSSHLELGSLLASEVGLPFIGESSTASPAVSPSSSSSSSSISSSPSSSPSPSSSSPSSSSFASASSSNAVSSSGPLGLLKVPQMPPKGAPIPASPVPTATSPVSTTSSAPPIISFGFAKVVKSIKDSLDGLTARFRSTNVPINAALGEERLFYFEADSSGKVKRNKLVEIILGPHPVKRSPLKIAACRIYGGPMAIDRRLKMFRNEIKPRIVSSSEMAETLDKCNEYFREQVKLLGLPQRRRSMSGFASSSSSQSTEASAPPLPPSSSSSSSSLSPSSSPSSSAQSSPSPSSPSAAASSASSSPSQARPVAQQASFSSSNETFAPSNSSASSISATSTIATSTADALVSSTEMTESDSTSTPSPEEVESIDRESVESIFSSSTASPLDESAGEYAHEDDTRGFLDGLAIYPGTKWCGMGTIADNYDDLGAEKKVDACCRDHDHCPDHISPGQSKFGLNNTDSYTKSSCECDENFYRCLQNARSFVGDQVGRMYFNVLQTPCFKKDFPVANCTDEKGFAFNTVRKACQSYKFHEDQPKVYQFFDAKFYDGKAGPLFNVPLVTRIIDKPLASVKVATINGGLIGNIIG